MKQTDCGPYNPFNDVIFVMPGRGDSILFLDIPLHNIRKTNKERMCI
jgi:hypothetical protein